MKTTDDIINLADAYAAEAGFSGDIHLHRKALRYAIEQALATADKSSVVQPVAIDAAFERWWDEEGCTAPKHRLDMSEHCYQVAKTAWSNGAYKALERAPQPQRDDTAHASDEALLRQALEALEACLGWPEVIEKLKERLK